jgi:ABC-type transport system substrate-binding protein
MKSPYPSPLLPAGAGSVNHPFNPAQVKAALPKGLHLTVVYTPDSSGVERRFADFMRQRLTQFGVVVNEKLVQLATVYGYPANPKQGADIYISTPTPDAAAADAWARIVWYTKGALNFFDYSNPRVDSLTDVGQRDPSNAQSEQDYAQAGVVAANDAGEVPVAQVNDVIVTRGDLTDIEHVPAYPWTINLGTLARK